MTANFSDVNGENVVTDIVIPADNETHDFTKQSQDAKYLKSAATCMAKAVYYYGCTRCDAVDTNAYEFGEKAPANHTKLVKTEAVEATCTKDGNIDYWSCEGCKKIYSDAAATTEITKEQTVITAAHILIDVEAKDATCTEAGWEAYKKCTRCDYTTTITARPALNHADKAKTEAKAQTCKDDGNIEYWYCSACKKYFKDEACTDGITLAETVVKADGVHKYVDYVYDGNANCTEDGTMTATCAYGCGTTDNKADPNHKADGTTHNFEFVKTVAPTCTEKGYDLYDCSRCDTTEKRNPVDAIDHDFTEEKIDEAHLVSVATCTKKAVYKYDCSRCDVIGEVTFETGEVNADNHTGLTTLEAVAPNCKETGLKEGKKCNACGEITVKQEIIPATGHSYTVTFKWDEAADSSACTVNVVCANDEKHNFTASATVTSMGSANADCVTAGTTTYEATYVLEEKTYTAKDTKTITGQTNPNNHTKLVKTDAVEATCTKDGNIDYWTCEGCNKIYSDAAATTEITKEQTVVGKTNHSYGEPEFSWSEDGKSCTVTFECIKKDDTQTLTATVTSAEKTAATCIAKGTTTYTAKVTFGDKDYTDTKDVEDIEIDSTNHVNREEKAKQAPTCTVVGYEAGVYCNDCKTWVSGHDEIAKLGHTFGEWSSNGNGTHSRECTVCTNEDDRVETGNCSGGTAYCNAEAICETCKTAYGEKAPNNHINLVKTDAVEATCIKDGNIDYWTCEGCKKIYSDAAATTEITKEQTVVGKTNHSYGEPEFTWNAAKTVATAKRTCEKGCVENLTVVMTSSSTDADCTKVGTTTYTATVTIGEEKFTDSQTIEGALGAHKLTTKVDYKAPNCTEPGNIEYWTCETCNKNFSDVNGENVVTDIVIPADNETHDFTKQSQDAKYLKSAATCMAKAVYYYGCTRCDAVDTNAYEFGEKNAVNHTKNNCTYSGAVEATCMAGGKLDDTYCECGVKIATGEPTEKAPANHTKNNCTYSGEVEATCMAGGKLDDTFCECGVKIAEGEPTEKAPANHTMNGLTYKDGYAATCTAEGKKDNTYCECGAKVADGETIPALEHNYSTEKTEANLTRPIYDDESGKWLDGYYTFVCSHNSSHKTTEPVKRADYSEYDKVVEEIEELLKDENLPDETKKAIKEALDEGKIDADKIATEQEDITESIEKLKKILENNSGCESGNHTGEATVIKNAKTATCYSEGYTGDKYWSCCDTLAEKGEYTGFAAHSWDKSTGVSVGGKNCLEPNTVVYKCVNYALCKNTHKEVAAGVGPHTLVIVNGMAATCVNDGKTSYEYCSVCNYKSESQTIPAFGHEDKNGDNVCDRCTDDLNSTSDGCICHKGNIFSKIIRYICTLFTKIFRTKITCCPDMEYWGTGISGLT